MNDHSILEVQVSGVTEWGVEVMDSAQRLGFVDDGADG